jgi:hypothetical protein
MSYRIAARDRRFNLAICEGWIRCWDVFGWNDTILGSISGHIYNIRVNLKNNIIQIVEKRLLLETISGMSFLSAPL